MPLLQQPGALRRGELFDAYRRPPAVILGIDVPYWTWEYGYAYRRRASAGCVGSTTGAETRAVAGS
jgi:hypothetical protein